MPGLVPVELIKCSFSINFILTYLQPSVTHNAFETTVNLRAFTFGMSVSDVTIEIGYLFLKS